MDTDPPKLLDYATAERQRSPWRTGSIVAAGVMIVVALVLLAGLAYGSFAILSLGKSD